MMLNRNNGINITLSNTVFRSLVTYDESFNGKSAIKVTITKLKSITGINLIHILPKEFIKELESKIVQKLNGVKS